MVIFYAQDFQIRHGFQNSPADIGPPIVTGKQYQAVITIIGFPDFTLIFLPPYAQPPTVLLEQLSMCLQPFQYPGNRAVEVSKAAPLSSSPAYIHLTPLMHSRTPWASSPPKRSNRTFKRHGGKNSGSAPTVLQMKTIRRSSRQRSVRRLAVEYFQQL